MKILKIKEEMLSCLAKGEVQKIVYTLMFAKEKKEIITIASYSEEEGKTTIAFLIGMELAKIGKSVLYVGFEEVPFIEAEQEREIKCNTNIPGFDILIKDNFYEDYEKYKNQYDYILIDSPATSKAKAGIFFADASDLILLVVEANRNSYKDVLDCKNDISISGCKDIRVILNKTRKTYGVFKKFRN